MIHLIVCLGVKNMCNGSKKVSIIIPIYNTGNYLAQCIDSLLAQSYKNIEIILINDGSVDNSETICQNYARKDERIRYFSQDNQGVSAARNNGLREATGSYVMFVDGDDWLESNAVSEMMCIIENNNTDGCYCSRYYQNHDTVMISTVQNLGLYIDAKLIMIEHLLYRFIASPCFSIVNLEKVKDCYFDEELFTLEDWEYNLRVLSRLESLSIIDRPYYHYRFVKGSASNSELTFRKLSCLLIPEKVNAYIVEHHQELVKYVDYVPVFLLNHMLVVLANSTYKKSEAEMLKKFARKQVGFSMTSRLVPFRQKIYTVMAAISPHIFCWSYRLKRRYD
ncbi:glycosyltransferase family 2 protein [Streptococcus uberis]|uniref:glycosyltransferase family 2 protein n=1 Tax=Streptococcus uberis TaxID=1349 RepID=UPI003D6A8AFD